MFNVLSPHLDDAALSCALFVAANKGSCITTVFAAGPHSVRPLTPWDKAARYFDEGADVMGIRRGEDVRSATVLGACTVHLSYWDRQYRNGQYSYTGPADEGLANVIAADLLGQRDVLPTGAWVIPLGLGHPDHRMTTDVGLLLAGDGGSDTYLYEDLPYAVENAAEAEDRRQYLARRGFRLQLDDGLASHGDRALKRAAIRCHRSQRRSLRRRSKVAERSPERIWKLVRT